MEEDVEVIFESWVLKLTGLDSRSVFRLSSQWKKRYMILIRQHESASVLYYSHKPSNLNATPNGMVVLEPYYRVEKRQNVRGQQFVVSLTTPTRRLVVAVNDERLFHLLTFFLQVQVKLNEDVEDECFVVRPDNTDDQRKIGARGNMCLLHVSPCGLTLALQLSKCVIVQWPLTCIRNYESTARGQFIVTVGKRASMGVGRYVFNMRLTQDNAIYDRLDRYVQDAAGLKHSHADNISQTSLVEQEHLHSLTYVQANPQFSNHLRKISRDIYDSLWQHLGSTRLKASSPDLVSDSPHVRQKVFRRTGSVGNINGAGSVPPVPTTPSQMARRHCSHPNASVMSSLASPDDFSSLPRNFRRTPSSKGSKWGEKKRQIPVEMIESTYLHPEDTFSEDNYENDAMLYQVTDPAMPEGAAAVAYGAGAPPPVLVPVTRKPPPGAVSGKSPQASRSPQKNRFSEPAKSPQGTPESSSHGSTSSEPVPSPAIMRSGVRPRLHRLQSRSCEDLMIYTDMSNGGDWSRDECIHKGYAKGGGGHMTNGEVYSYATQNEVQETRAAAQRLALRRASGSYQKNSLPRDPIPTGFIQKPLLRKQSMIKAMSNPSLLDLEQRHFGARSGPGASLPATHPVQWPPLPDSYSYRKGADWTIGNSSGTSTTSPSKTPQLESPSTSVTSSILKSPAKMKVTTSTEGDGASAFANRARGIPATSPSKVFRKPKYEVHSLTTKGMSGQWGVSGDDDQRHGSSSSGYASSGGGGGTIADIKETHC